MTAEPSTETATGVRPRRSSVDKGEQRRIALAESALKTLGELGYARTSLREIAANSEFSHGVVHYYFRDKSDLIGYCVRYYKTTCAKRYDEVIATATTADDLAAGFLDRMVQTLVEDTPMHRLWYDLRTQSMFEPAVRDDVTEIDVLLEDMVWRVLSRYAELAGGEPAIDQATAYGVVDGLFEQAVIGTSRDVDVAVSRLRTGVARVVGMLVTAP